MLEMFCLESIHPSIQSTHPPTHTHSHAFFLRPVFPVRSVELKRKRNSICFFYKTQTGDRKEGLNKNRTTCRIGSQVGIEPAKLQGVSPGLVHHWVVAIEPPLNCSFYSLFCFLVRGLIDLPSPALLSSVNPRPPAWPPPPPPMPPFPSPTPTSPC